MKLLGDDLRNALYRVLRENPNVEYSVADLCYELGIGSWRRSNVLTKLNELVSYPPESDFVIIRRKTGRYVRFYGKNDDRV